LGSILSLTWCTPAKSGPLQSLDIIESGEGAVEGIERQMTGHSAQPPSQAI
jgi:hypothetical protein